MRMTPGDNVRKRDMIAHSLIFTRAKTAQNQWVLDCLRAFVDFLPVPRSMHGFRRRAHARILQFCGFAIVELVTSGGIANAERRYTSLKESANAGQTFIGIKADIDFCFDTRVDGYLNQNYLLAFVAIHSRDVSSELQRGIWFQAGWMMYSDGYWVAYFEYAPDSGWGNRVFDEYLSLALPAPPVTPRIIKEGLQLNYYDHFGFVTSVAWNDLNSRDMCIAAFESEMVGWPDVHTPGTTAYPCYFRNCYVRVKDGSYEYGWETAMPTVRGIFRVQDPYGRAVLEGAGTVKIWDDRDQE